MFKLKALVVGTKGVLPWALRQIQHAGLPEIEVTEVEWHKALSLAHEKKYHGIFTDQQIPEKDALELAGQVRGGFINRTTPLIIGSPQTAQAAIERALEIGGALFLRYPFEPADLLSTMKIVHLSAAETRRRSMRVPLLANVFYRLRSHSFSGTAKNISVDGMLLDIGTQMILVQSVHFSIQLPDLNPSRITVIGRVVHCDHRSQLGVQFTAMDSGARERLRRLVAGDQDGEVINNTESQQ